MIPQSHPQAVSAQKQDFRTRNDIHIEQHTSGEAMWKSKERSKGNQQNPGNQGGKL